MALTLPSAAPPSAQLNKAFQAEESPSVIYCISMQWFREWEAFVKGKGKDNGECSMAWPTPQYRCSPCPRAVTAGRRGVGGCPLPGLLAAAGLAWSYLSLPSRPVPSGAFPSCRALFFGGLLALKKDFSG